MTLRHSELLREVHLLRLKWEQERQQKKKLEEKLEAHNIKVSPLKRFKLGMLTAYFTTHLTLEILKWFEFLKHLSGYLKRKKKYPPSTFRITC